ncbi:membrane-anchored ubiquitin-fold protein 6 isoform X2 [Mangifera indica]|uniref:membrane-anchored ubiquitin-fold protein 6 isoform X2 n=1 Tax=Mangifera indica TaxID=29780 RepID=UPI001CFBF8D4|nr:membrane-anchored ubiquitin-fold protein 6 isoform X2 [Mangifera indica]
MAEEDLIELKFRLADGTDIGPNKYSPATTVASLKEKIIAQWPKDKENGPKVVNNLQLIHAGKILENNRTIADSRLPVVELPGGVITMHVVLRPHLPDKNNKLQNDHPNKSRCSCTIL